MHAVDEIDELVLRNSDIGVAGLDNSVSDIGLRSKEIIMEATRDDLDAP